MKRIDNRQKTINQLRVKKTPDRKGIPIDEARKYFRRKDHPESPTFFWKSK